MNIFTDKYFEKAKMVAEKAGLNPIVRYRVFGRFDGVAALEPVKFLIEKLSPTVKVEILPTGTPFVAKDTIMIIEDKFQNIVEYETQYLQWAALPCYCAHQARQIVEAAEGKSVMDFSARHLYDPTSVALASYGAQVGGIKTCSTDVGANALSYLSYELSNYKRRIEFGECLSDLQLLNKGIGTTPHALIAIFKGDYSKMAKAYIDAFPDENFIALIDYNNKEIDDTIDLLKEFGDKLYGVRIDTCGENYAQTTGTNMYGHKGVTLDAVLSLRSNLDSNGGKEVKIFVSSGFNAEKTAKFMKIVGDSFDGIGTGSFIPKGPCCTADIFEVDGERECKVGREWGFEANEEFYKKIGEKI